MALGSSVPEGLEAAAAAGLSLDDITKKLPSYSMARVANESDEFVIRAPFPMTNVSPKDDPMPLVPDGLELLESAGFWVDGGLSLPARAGYDVRADVMR